MALNKHYKKIILGVLIAAIVVGAGGVFNTTLAQEKGIVGGIINSIGDAAVSGVVSTLGYIIGAIAGLILATAAYLIELSLNINAQILSSVFVTTGWNIVLSFTNLGFVLAIIVMAFATILRWESYGMKQILWKLIVAALLVNFSLVIAGAFLSVADILTNYLMEHGGFTNYSDWPLRFANMFKIQQFLQAKPEFDPEGLGVIGNFGTKVVGTSLAALASLMFSVLFTVITGIMFLAIAAMLLIRYIFISILLILSPIVWLLWIFPDTQNLWQKWWDNFLRWTFFAPIMLFFLYLAVYTMNNAPAAISDVAVNHSNTSKGVTFGIDVIGNFAIVLGLVLGGLMAANYLSITGASTAMGMAQKAGKGVGMFAWKKGQQYGTRGAEWTNRTLQRNIGGVEAGKERSIATAMSEFTTKHRWAGRLGVGYVAQGVAKWSAAATENQVKQAKDNIKDKNIPEQVAMLSTGDVAARAAILQNLRDKELLHLVPQEFIDKNILTHKERERWQAMGQAKEYEKLERRLGRNVEMVSGKDVKGNKMTDEVEIETKDDKGNIIKTKKKRWELNEDKFFGTFRHEDWQKLSADSLLDEIDHTSSNRTYGNIRMKAIAENDPSALATILSKAKQEQIGKIKKEINNIEKNIVDNLIATNLNAGKDIISDLDNIIKSIEGPSFDIGAAGLMDATDPVKNITKKLEWIQKKDKNKFNGLQDDIKLILQRNKTINRNLAGRFSEFEFVPGAFQQQTP